MVLVGFVGASISANATVAVAKDTEVKVDSLVALNSALHIGREVDPAAVEVAVGPS